MKRNPDAYLYPRQIGAGVWLEQDGELIRTLAAAQPERRAVQLWTTTGPKRLEPRTEYAVWFSNPNPYSGDPNAPF